MAKLGWAVRTTVTLPPLWELREDEDFLYLFDPTGGVVVLGKHTTVEVIEELIKEETKC